MLMVTRAQDAVDHYDMALRIAAKQRMQDMEGRLYNGLASVYFEAGEKEEALRCSRITQAPNPKTSTRNPKS